MNNLKIKLLPKNKAIKRNSILLFVVVNMISFFSSCSTPTVIPPASRIELNIINSLPLNDAGSITAWHLTLNAFKSANPGIKLNIKNYKEWNDYDAQLQALDSLNQLPDVISSFSSAYFTKLMKKGVLQDLFPLLGDEIDNYQANAIIPYHNGKLYSLAAKLITSHVLYANTQLIDELHLSIPQSYVELVGMKDKIINAGLIPIISAYKEPWFRQSCLFSTILGRVAGIKWFNNALLGNSSFNDVQFINSLNMLKDFFDTDLIPADCLDLDYGTAVQKFLDGKGVFLVNGDWMTADLRRLPVKKQEKIAFLVFPALPNEERATGSTSIYAPGFAMKSGISPEKQAAAWKWIKFYAGSEAALIRIKYTDDVPAYKLDLTNEKMDIIKKKKVEFHSGIHPALPIMDMIIRGYPMDVLQTGLLDFVMNTKTASQVADEFETAIQTWR